MPLNLDSLRNLNDDELHSAIEFAHGLLRQRDEERKAKALSDARALLASVGLSFKNVAVKGRGKPAKGLIYKGGHLYQHPSDKALVWNAKGQKPNWLRELEAQGGKTVELTAPGENAATVQNGSGKPASNGRQTLEGAIDRKTGMG